MKLGNVIGKLPIIELLGVAGAGKTTLRRMLMEKSNRIKFVVPPAKRHYLLPVVKKTAIWLPNYIAHFRKGRWFGWEELKLIEYVETWIPHLHKQVIAAQSRVLLDPGSVYWLTALRYFGPEFTKGEEFEQWWNKMLLHWADVLEMIVWIDAPEDILYDRVLARNDWHEAKKQTHDEALKIFRLLREGYEETVRAMEIQGGPKIIRFRSDKSPPEEILHGVLSNLDEIESSGEIYRDATRSR